VNDKISHKRQKKTPRTSLPQALRVIILVVPDEVNNTSQLPLTLGAQTQHLAMLFITLQALTEPFLHQALNSTKNAAKHLTEPAKERPYYLAFFLLINAHYHFYGLGI